MYLVFFCIAIIFVGFFYSNKLKVKENFSLFVSISTIMAWGIIFAMINILQIGVFIMYAIVLIGGGIYVAKKRKDFAHFLCQLPIVAFIVAFITTLVLFTIKSPFFCAWDEFSHWGPFLFSIKYTNKLHIYVDRNFVHQAYPQVMTVLYYIGSFWNSNYDEASVCVIFYILLNICTITIIPVTSIKKGKVFNINILMIILAPFFLYLFPYAGYAAPYTTAYLDAVLGTYFGATIFYLIWNRKECCNRINEFCIAIMLFVLLQIKDTSIAFYMICLATYVINVFVYNILQAQQKKIIINGLKICFYGVIVPMIGKIMWSSCLKVTGKSFDQFSDPIISKFVALTLEYFNGENNYFGSVAHSFWEGIKNVNISWERTSILVIVFGYSIIGFYIAYKYYVVENTKIIYLYLGLFNIYYLCYMLMLFIIYLCAMSPDEAARSASMDRYVACFMSGWGFLLFALASNYLFKYRPKLVVATICSAVIFVYATIPLNDIVYFKGDKASTGMVWFEQKADIIKEYVNSNETVWLMQSDENVAWHQFIWSYKLMPCQVAENMPMSFDSLSIEEMISMMNESNVDYLVVINSGELFNDMYGNNIIDKNSSSTDEFMLLKLADNMHLQQLY